MRALHRTLALTCVLSLAPAHAPLPSAFVFPAVRRFGASVPRPELAPYLSVAVPMADRDRAATVLRLALQRERQGDLAPAMAAFDQAAHDAPWLADWASLLAARAAARAGDTSAVEVRLSRTEPVLAREWGWRIRVMAFRNARAPARAEAIAVRAGRAFAMGGRAGAAYLAAADAALAQGDTGSARDYLRRSLGAAPAGADAESAAVALAATGRLDREDHLLVGRSQIARGQTWRGVEHLRAGLAWTERPSAAASGLRLEIARALFGARRYDEAVRAALEGAADPGADALWLAGRAEYRQGHLDAAQALMIRAAAHCPGVRAGCEALFVLADLHQDAGEVAAARARFEALVRLTPRTDVGARAQMRLGGLSFSRGDFGQAARTFEQYRAHHATGSSGQQAAYWAARALAAAGDSATARTRFVMARELDPGSYYGLLAGDALGTDAQPATAAAPPPEPRADRLAGVAVGRLMLLRALQLDDAANYEGERVRRFFAGDLIGLYAAADSLHARGETGVALRIGREIYAAQRRWNDRLLRIVYPFPFQAVVLSEARRRDVDPFVIAAIIRQESSFDPDARSAAGAIGLMQVMPATARQLAPRLGLRHVNPARLRSPATNVRLGVAHVADLLAETRGRLPDALAAYNAGTTRLARWRAFPEHEDVELFAERIPFAETREYVQIVQRNARLYAYLYGGDALAAATGN